MYSFVGGVFRPKVESFDVSLKLSSYVHKARSSLLMKAANGGCASMEFEEDYTCSRLLQP